MFARAHVSALLGNLDRAKPESAQCDFNYVNLRRDAFDNSLVLYEFFSRHRVMLMGTGIHFISGLPRSGSTLLSALLRQNPGFVAGISSPVSYFYLVMQMALSTKNEFHAFITDQHRISVLRGLFTNFYAVDYPDKLIFDTSRVWSSKLSGLAQLFPDCKMICCVRSVAWIIDSFERLYHSNALQPSKIYNPDLLVHSVNTRAEQLTGPNGMVRVAYDGLREAFLGQHSDRLLLVQYESLARSPESTMATIYDFLGVTPFAHDFRNVEYEADEFDRIIGAPGLHKVAREVRYVERPTILPAEIFRNLDKPMTFWKESAMNTRNVRIV